MLEILLIRPGSTTFDQEGRIKGALDIPLSEQGHRQAEALARELEEVSLDCLYVAPCESAQQSAVEIRKLNPCKQKTLDCLRNMDHGLWQGKLLADVKRLQPKVYRQFQDHPEDVCPPQGETIDGALGRIEATVAKLLKRHRKGRIGILVPQPLAAVVRYAILGGSLGDMWKCELDFGTFEALDVSDGSATSVVGLATA
ncbi:histidine phosphatase family protein [Aureliella helgolandensis]|uniref:Phosphoserine phosphatase 1 n=1 Tax=Aureliella helgolandensis TaxID=2527968 RepID=A0A518G5Q1_9BACT|nr:histidine phosphatase family protein [Aureliella helgolandensis]QDV23921.1 Phosphoserine phosphatase 1 [Aureliella helgolandensis]